MKRQPPLQTDEEIRMVIDFLLLEVVRDVLDRDVESMRAAPLKMLDVYVKAMRNVQFRVIGDLVRLKAQLKQRGIRICERKRTETRLEAHYLCRGYSHRCALLWEFVRAQARVRLGAYLNVDLADGDTTL